MDVDIECGNGWRKIINPIIEYIEKYNSTVKKEENKIKILQIKEKFGELRFYASNKTPELVKLIENAEAKSRNICELCGSEEDIGQIADGWITTCCRKCAEKMAESQKRSRLWYSYKTKKREVIKHG